METLTSGLGKNSATQVASDAMTKAMSDAHDVFVQRADDAASTSEMAKAYLAKAEQYPKDQDPKKAMYAHRDALVKQRLAEALPI